MRRLFCLAVMFIIIGTGVEANAQYRVESYYLSVSGGAISANKQCSPTVGVRFGVESMWLVSELEVDYLSVKSGGDKDSRSFSTMTAGVNLGYKFVQGRIGYLAATASVGYALQEDWHRGKSCDYYDYYCYGCCDYGYDYGYGSHGCGYNKKHHDKAYFGVGLSGVLDITSRIALFAECRFQNIPVNGKGDTSWGFNTQGGVRFYF